MSAQGGDGVFPVQHGPRMGSDDIDALLKVLTDAGLEFQSLGWPHRLHLFRPGEYIVDGQPYDEYVCALLIPIVPPVDAWRQAVRKERA